MTTRFSPCWPKAEELDEDDEDDEELDDEELDDEDSGFFFRLVNFAQVVLSCPKRKQKQNQQEQEQRLGQTKTTASKTKQTLRENTRERAQSTEHRTQYHCMLNKRGTIGTLQFMNATQENTVHGDQRLFKFGFVGACFWIGQPQPNLGRDSPTRQMNPSTVISMVFVQGADSHGAFWNFNFGIVAFFGRCSLHGALFGLGQGRGGGGGGEGSRNGVHASFGFAFGRTSRSVGFGQFHTIGRCFFFRRSVIKFPRRCGHAFKGIELARRSSIGAVGINGLVGVAFPQTGERLTHGSKCLGGSSFV